MCNLPRVSGNASSKKLRGLTEKNHHWQCTKYGRMMDGRMMDRQLEFVVAHRGYIDSVIGLFYTLWFVWKRFETWWFLNWDINIMYLWVEINCSKMNTTTKSYHVIYMIIVLHRDLLQMWQLKDSTANPMRSFLRKKTSFGYCFSETNILILCNYFVLHKLLKTIFEGSRWKLLELTCASRYLAYVSTRIQVSNQ